MNPLLKKMTITVLSCQAAMVLIAIAAVNGLISFGTYIILLVFIIVMQVIIYTIMYRMM